MSSQFDGFLEDLNPTQASQFESTASSRAVPWEVGGVYIGKAPDDFGAALSLDEDYLQMARNARDLADLPGQPPRDDAFRVYRALCIHWLDRINESLLADRYAIVALAESIFGFSQDEDPQMLRLEAAYNFHCGIVGCVYEVCKRANILCPEELKANPDGEFLELRSGRRQKRRRSRRDDQDGAGRDDIREDNEDGDEEGAEVPLWKKRKLDVTLRLNKVIEVVYHLHELLHTSFRATLSCSPDEPVLRPVNEFDLMRFTHLPMENLSSFQALIIALSRFFVHKRYRRSEDYICVETMLPSPGHRGRLVHSHYWKPTKLIREVITEFCNKDTHGTAWVNSTKITSNFENAVRYFSDGRDNDLPSVNPHPRLFSFRNGLLFLGKELPGYVDTAPLRDDGHGRFFTYDGSGGFHSDSVPLDVHSSRFFKCEFPEEWIEMLNSGLDFDANILCWSPTGPDGRSGPFVPTAFPTPIFDGLFRRQGYTFFCDEYDEFAPYSIPVLSSLFQIYAMFGRLLYRVNELDNFQLCIFLLGVAGTGKSVICEIIAKFYGKEAVGKMSANCQQTFALSGFVKKHLIICPEVKSNFGLAASDFQSMVTGESVSANVKHKEIVTIRKWPSQMLMAGNDVPPWSDSLGALFRRLLVVRLTNAVRDEEVDTDMARNLRCELPALLIKFHACYIYLLKTFRNASFWLFADQKFLDARTSLELELSPTKKFLSTSDDLDRDCLDDRVGGNFTVYIPYTRLMELCTDWCRKQGIGSGRMSSSNREDHNRKILSDSKYRLEVLNLPFTAGCAERQADYVLGITDHSAPLMLPANWNVAAAVVLPVV